MAEIIVMPKLSDTMEEGVVAKWVKKEGDKLGEGDLLAEIETDKATMEYESPVDGVLLKILAPAGSKLKVGDPIAAYGEAGETYDAAAKPAAKAAPEPSKPTPPQAVVTKAAPAAAANKTTPAASAPATKSTPKPGGGSDGARIVASPLAKKLAREQGVDIGQLQGTGPNGRIVARDLSGAATAPDQRAAAPTAAVRPTGEDRIVPASMMRQTIAKRLHAAKNDAPHFYLTRSCNMAAALAWRQRLNEGKGKADDANAVKVSVNDIVMMAAARALTLHPGCNASWQGESIREYAAVHMAMAVALPTGLITPVIRHCDQLGVRDIARQAKAYAAKAKAGELTPADYTGGTFTVSNLGMFGIESFTAIINPPQAAILAVGATIATPWVNEAQQVVVEQRMTLTLSCDHRVIDGAMGAQLLATIVNFLEDPLAILG